MSNGSCEIEEPVSQEATESSEEECQNALFDCLVCGDTFEDREQLDDHVADHLKSPELRIERVKEPEIQKDPEKPVSRSFARKRIRPYSNKTLISQVIEPEVDPDSKYPAVPKLRILRPSQLCQQVENEKRSNSLESSHNENSTESTDAEKLNNSMRPSSASSTNSSVHKAEMVESQMLPNDTQSPKFPSQSPIKTEIGLSQTETASSFWGQDNNSHTSSDSGIQIRESGEKEVERHDTLLQNFLNDTVNSSKDPGMILPGPVETEFISLDRLAGNLTFLN